MHNFLTYTMNILKSKQFIIGYIVLGVAFFVFVAVSNMNNQANQDVPHQGTLAPDFTLNALNGGTITLSDYRGEKPVILDFFATWCPNCRRDMPKLSGWYDQYRDQVEVIGVNLREQTATVQNYITSTGISFPIVFDPSGGTANAYQVQYTNTHVLINKEGTVVRVIPGDITEQDIQDLIES